MSHRGRRLVNIQKPQVLLLVLNYELRIEGRLDHLEELEVLTVLAG
jgi:hypothetical protein